MDRYNAGSGLFLDEKKAKLGRDHEAVRKAVNPGMKTIVCSFVLIVFCLTAPDALAAEYGQKPNVIVILSDDQGWGDIGYNNPARVYTPNLDSLAAAGVMFKSHYVMPQCTPTRVALFTGRYPGRFGRTPLQATNEKCFPVGTPTLAAMFKSAGYETYLCGKWHMGSAPENGPNHYGFDHSYGSLGGAVGMYDHRYRAGKYEMSWHRDLEFIAGYENGKHATDLVAQEAVSIIEGTHKKPFFLYLAFNAPHTPLDERGDFVDTPTQLDPNNPNRWLNEDKIKWFNDPAGKIQKETDPEKRLLLAAVHHLDSAIGQVVRALEKSGQRENTLILFSSDNGPQVDWGGDAYPDDLKLTNFNQPIPMKGNKTDVWEGGIHVPGFANWPGHIPARQIQEQTHVVDWFATLAGLIDYKPSEAMELDGTNLCPILFHDGALAPRDLYWIWNPSINRRALRYGEWKIVRYGTGEPESPKDWQLYNIKEDPQEQHDIASQYPERLEELHQLFVKQRQKDQE